MPSSEPRNRFLTMLALVISGEAIFFLPFILPRVFRPILLDVFQITNFEFGSAFAAYGVVAMVSYFFGGPIADRAPARNLMSLALLATAAGGFLMAIIPSFRILTAIYAFWGLTTILLFWAALIRATREWGGTSIQGKAFGILDGGRGLSAALISTVGVVVIGQLLPADVQSASSEEQTRSLQYVILTFSSFTSLISIFVWFALPGGTVKGDHNFSSDLSGIKFLIKKPSVWLHAIFLLCGYVAYKVTDDFSLYASDVIGLDDVEASRMGALGIWLRPIVAVTAGFLADRFQSSKLIIISFILIIIGGIAVSSGFVEIGIVIPYIFLFLFVGSGAFALRVLYYSVMEEAKIPLMLTGTMVGIISVVGYTPDIFVGPLMGWLLDSSPGAEGHRHLFMALTVFGLIGLFASIWFRKEIYGLKTK